jgi:opacity protein-like surface antigen
MPRIFTALLALMIAAGAAPTNVSAQGTAQDPPPPQVRRPYRGIFGAPRPAGNRHSLDLTFSAFGAFDEDVYASETGTELPEDAQKRGWLGGLSAGLTYNRPGDRLSFAADAGAGVSFYANQEERQPTYRANIAAGLPLTRRTRLSIAQGVVYAPEYRLGLFVDAADPAALQDPFSTLSPDYDLFRLRSLRSSSSVSLSHSVGRRSSLDAWYVLSAVSYLDEDFGYRSQGAGGRFTQQMTRNLGLRLGYAYNSGDFDDPASDAASSRPQRVHSIDAGIDYGRALSVSRRTELSFSTGSALIVTDETPLDPAGRTLTYRLIGSAGLSHEIGRTWTATAYYNRGVQFYQGFDQPLLTDGVSAGLSGFFSRRLRFSSSVSYSFGTVGVSSENSFDTLGASAGLDYALSRFLAVYARYIYYSYKFDDQVVLDPRFAQALDRQGVRIGLNASFPLIR